MSALRQLSNPVRSTPPKRQPPTVKPTRRAKTSPQGRQQQQQTRNRVLAIETSMKIAMNVLISGVALTTLFTVIPNRVSQQQKLQELKAEVGITENRVNQLKTDFNRAFDPGQERQIAQEQTHFTDPNRIPVVLLNRKGQATANLPDN
jgi:hypothetical protein